ncbi:MAG: hypothetical protein NZ932_06120 [Candidatus Bathyarchaeota archaeon]|nr:hypothetical protein [Candidatus Bathyarchaeota archaeon]MDW8040882.1 hypothetical protein [Nitrososphaerota archaeon]
MRKVYGAWLSVMVGLTLFYAFQGHYPSFMYFFSNSFPPVISGVTVVISGLSLERYWRKAKGPFSKAWFYFTAGLFLWFLGEAVWAGYALILGVEVPYPSIADVFWLAGYVPLFIALYLYVKIFGGVLTKKTLAASIMATVILAIVVAGVLLAPILNVEEDLWTLVADFAYPLSDLALFSVAHLGLIVFWKGKLGKPWLFINAAIAMNMGAGILFSYTTAYGIYYCGHMLELLYHFSYLSLILAFYLHTKEL